MFMAVALCPSGDSAPYAATAPALADHAHAYGGLSPPSRPHGEATDARGDTRSEQHRQAEAAAAPRLSRPSYGPSSSPSLSSRSSSNRPRGGQSSCASQRLVQCRLATFCSGTRMCPFSSTWATSSIRQ
jgi:hypothetical protein